jgi:hypothetical protein
MTTEASMSLDTIETAFTVFETDQVLTADQLNGVADYLDDQQRLTRAALLGVGIACGLWPSLQAGAVRLSGGVGTTTDGDVLYFPGASLYDHYKPYDATTPKYAPFAAGDGAIAAFELLTAEQADGDARAEPLPGFDAAESPRTLAGMVAVLYVESYLHDPDLCTATDCDNRGKNWQHTTRLLLVDAASAGALREALDTPDAAARALQPVPVARPVLSGALATESDLAAVYGAACDAIHQALLAALGRLWAPCKWFLRDLAPADPGPRWQKTLADLRAKAPVRGMQYYYDFLKDLAETCNAFRDALFGDTAVCCPSLDAFPKHLLLGGLDPAQRAAVGRTGFYPSPEVSDRFEQRAHARFLVRKIDALIANFAIPGPGQIRVTPSAFEDRALEQRAVPFYYLPAGAAPIQGAWSHALSRRGMEPTAYSYNADRWAVAGTPAAAPLQFQTGAFDFLRIEGHVGRPLAEVQRELDALVTGANLPVDVVYLALAQPVRPPIPWRNRHLYELQHLMRSELGAQLDDTNRFGTAFLDQVKTAAAANLVSDQDNGGVPVVGSAQTKIELMNGKAGAARAKIMAETYDPASNWQDDVAGVAQAAADMHESLSPVTKKQFVTPLDSVIAGQPARWLNWIDILIKGNEDDAARRSQLPGFLADHPGLEHYAGTLRGGTFVVVYDAANLVVADFMLPYRCCEPKVAPPPPPKLVPLPWPDVVFTKPIRMVTLPDKFQFTKLSDTVINQVKGDVQTQVSYLNGLKDTIGILAGVKTSGGFTLPGVTTGPQIALDKLPENPALQQKVIDIAQKQQVVDQIRTQSLDPTLTDAQRTTLDAQRAAAEKDLAVSIVAATTHVADAGVAVIPGSDGAKVIEAASSAFTGISNIDALSQVEKGVMSVAGAQVAGSQVQVALNSMLGLRMM